MEMIFVKLFHMGIQASIAIGVILLVRELFKLTKVPKKFAYILWVIPFIRLVCPFDIQSPFSIMPDLGKYQIYDIEEQDMSEEIMSDMSLSENASDEIVGDMSLTENASDEIMGDMSLTDNIALEPSSVSNQQSLDILQTTYGMEHQDGVETTISSESVDQSEGNIYHVSQGADVSESNIVGNNTSENASNNTGIDEVIPVESHIKPIEVASITWFVIVIAIYIYSVATLLVLRSKLKIKAPISNDVYMVDSVDTAFVLGLTKPIIYVPSRVSDRDLEYVVSHERYHIRRLDYMIKPIAYFVVAIYWYNPVVWLAYFMMEKDMEMSCDEAVLGKLGIENKADYAKALLKLSSGRHYALSMPTAFAEGSTKGRVKNIMKIKKPVVIVAVIAVIVIGVLGVVLLTNPKDATNTTTEVTKTELVYGRYSMVLPEREEEITPYVAPYKEEYVFVPYVDIFEDGTAVFCYDPFNSYYPYAEAEYVLEDNVLSMTTEGGRTYTFNVLEDGSLTFDDEASYDMKITENEFLTEISDGTQFVLDETASPDYIETYIDMMNAAALDGYGLGYYFIEEVIYDNVNVSEDMILGSDGVVLDYVDENIIIFHGYAGLFVYNRNTLQIQSSVDLAKLGLDKTQGDEYCDVLIGGDGQYVYLVPMKNGTYNMEVFYDEITGITLEDSLVYRYHVESSTMAKGPWDSLLTYNIPLVDVTANTSECVDGIENAEGFYSYSCVEVSEGVYGYLTCSTGLWKDICYVESDMVYMMYDQEYMDDIDEMQALIDEMEAQVEEVENNLDALLSDELYQEIISKYNIAVYQGWSAEEMEQEGLCPYADKYSLYDVNMDGVEELLIGKKDVAGVMYDIYDIYTVENGELIQVTDGAETESYTIYETGIIRYDDVDYSTSDAIEFAHYYLINGVLYDITELGEKEILWSDEVINSGGFVEAASIEGHALIELEFTKFE